MLDASISAVLSFERRLKDTLDLIELAETENDEQVLKEANDALIHLQKEVSQKELEECICNSYEVSRQQSIFCKLVKKKTYGFIKGFFVIKKFISSIR